MTPDGCVTLTESTHYPEESISTVTMQTRHPVRYRLHISRVNAHTLVILFNCYAERRTPQSVVLHRSIMVFIVHIKWLLVDFPLFEPVANTLLTLSILANGTALGQLDSILDGLPPYPLCVCLPTLPPLQFECTCRNLSECRTNAPALHVRTCCVASFFTCTRAANSPLSCRDVSTTWPKWKDTDSVTCSGLGLIIATSPTCG